MPAGASPVLDSQCGGLNALHNLSQRCYRHATSSKIPLYDQNRSRVTDALIDGKLLLLQDYDMSRD